MTIDQMKDAMSEAAAMIEMMSMCSDHLKPSGTTHADLVELVQSAQQIAEFVEQYQADRRFTSLEDSDIEDTVTQWLEDCEEADEEENREQAA